MHQPIVLHVVLHKTSLYSPQFCQVMFAGMHLLGQEYTIRRIKIFRGDLCDRKSVTIPGDCQPSCEEDVESVDRRSAHLGTLASKKGPVIACFSRKPHVLHAILTLFGLILCNGLVQCTVTVQAL